MRHAFLPMHWANATAVTASHLQPYLGELLPGQLPDDAFHLQGKQGSENVAGIQSGRFDDVVNRLGCLCAP
jgi:hypothetical protein